MVCLLETIPATGFVFMEGTSMLYRQVYPTQLVKLPSAKFRFLPDVFCADSVVPTQKETRQKSSKVLPTFISCGRYNQIIPNKNMKNAWTLFIIQPYSKSRDGILPLLCLYRWD